MTARKGARMISKGLLPDMIRADVEMLWDYHDLHHVERPADVGVGLGSHDLGVAICAADLYHRGVFPLIVFTFGAPMNDPFVLGMRSADDHVGV
ncbi:hypothetical protein [Streptosporangium sp. KLBMP 9127]|nr:hypothetical protein [Streptosporangium sp. KLBMP 9127]